MYAKVCLAALFAAVATTANAQEPKLCEPSCDNMNVDQNAYVSSCCQQYEAHIGTNFDACCASSCDMNSPCKWENLGSASGVVYI
ncbi:hypothetical protein DVH05_016330 [Phytophthora capsici]|nr:hypothetical protein DVH05_016330 [Phytophthora capsici]